MTAIDSNLLGACTFLVGNPNDLDNRPVPVWAEERKSFLADLSSRLIANPLTRTMPDVMSFAWWCRRANLAKLEKQTGCFNHIRVGLGLVFHLCPSNVPVNFAFSMAFGLLAGNSGALRLPSKESPAINLILEAMNSLLEEDSHASLRRALLLMRYAHDDVVNAHWLGRADGRIIWGGDETVKLMRGFEVPPRSREVAFPDRYSLVAMNARAVRALEGDALESFCGQLFNDIYQMDQAACSSPQLVVWTGASDDVRGAKQNLWPAFRDHVRSRYELAPIQVMDKFVDACNVAASHKNVTEIIDSDHLLYRYELERLDPGQDAWRGYNGAVYELHLAGLDDLAPIVGAGWQTLTYYGFQRSELAEFVAVNRLRGIDRIVPVGKALDMDIIWDGYDLISALSRIVDIIE